MSIISKALKKAQEKRAGNGGLTEEEVPMYLSRDTIHTKAVTTWRQNSYLRFFVMISFGAIVLGGFMGVLMVYVNRPVPAQPPPVLSVPEKPVPVQKQVSPAKKPDIVKPASDKAAKADLAKPVDLPALNGIMYSPANPRAVINGTMVEEGDEINGFTILTIFSNKVKISFENKEYTLKLL
jgi:hypothetical protein